MAVICGEVVTFCRIRGNSAAGAGRLGTVVERLGTVVVPLGTVGYGWRRLKAGRAPSEAVRDRCGSSPVRYSKQS
jgi:hypothetical protein